jgi:hypothetical protein
MRPADAPPNANFKIVLGIMNIAHALVKIGRWLPIKLATANTDGRRRKTAGCMHRAINRLVAQSGSSDPRGLA